MTSSLIHVLFIDADTGNMFADAHIPADQLPASFDAECILPLRESLWRVVGADPFTAEEFIRAGKLVLLVEPAERPPQLSDETA